MQSIASKLVKKIKECGYVKNIPRSGHQKSATNEDQALAVLVSAMPSTSTMQLAWDSMTQSSII